jgi:protein tyrosine phosphatase (PTP) superfamily phosphohydrolase (DUF442 family)
MPSDDAAGQDGGNGMINGLNPLNRSAATAAVAATRPPASAAQGPNEQALLKDSHKLSFRMQAKIYGEMVELTTKHPSIDRLQNKLLGLFAKPHKTPVPGNLDQVVPGLYRGAQPGPEGFQYLAKIGVKTVINLSDETNYDTKWATAAGIKVVDLPEDGFGPPTDAQTRTFLKTVTDPATGPVFFHCVHGADRTGTMAAAYRIAVQGWSADQAIGELSKHGFNTTAELNKLQYIKDFAAKWQGNAAGFLAAGS